MSRWDVVLKEGARQNGHRDPCGLALLSTLPPFPGSPRGAVPHLPPGTSHAVHPTQLPAPTRAQHPASPRDWVRGGHAARAEPVSAAPGPSRKRLCRRRLLSWPPPSLWGLPVGPSLWGSPCLKGKPPRRRGEPRSGHRSRTRLSAWIQLCLKPETRRPFFVCLFVFNYVNQ